MQGEIKVWKYGIIKPHIKHPFNYALTIAPGDAMSIAANAKNQGFTRVVAVGGDGTVCEVANGIVGTDIELGIIPAGTGNDFVKTLKIPQLPIEALAVIENGQIYTVDIGKQEKGYYINVSVLGFDAEVVNTTNVYLK